MEYPNFIEEALQLEDRALLLDVPNNLTDEQMEELVNWCDGNSISTPTE